VRRPLRQFGKWIRRNYAVATLIGTDDREWKSKETRTSAERGWFTTRPVSRGVRDSGLCSVSCEVCSPKETIADFWDKAPRDFSPMSRAASAKTQRNYGIRPTKNSADAARNQVVKRETVDELVVFTSQPWRSRPVVLIVFRGMTCFQYKPDAQSECIPACLHSLARLGL